MVRFRELIENDGIQYGVLPFKNKNNTKKKDTMGR